MTPKFKPGDMLFYHYTYLGGQQNKALLRIISTPNDQEYLTDWFEGTSLTHFSIEFIEEHCTTACDPNELLKEIL